MYAFRCAIIIQEKSPNPKRAYNSKGSQSVFLLNSLFHGLFRFAVGLCGRRALLPFRRLVAYGPRTSTYISANDIDGRCRSHGNTKKSMASSL